MPFQRWKFSTIIRAPHTMGLQQRLNGTSSGTSIARNRLNPNEIKGWGNPLRATFKILASSTGAGIFALKACWAHENLSTCAKRLSIASVSGEVGSTGPVLFWHTGGIRSPWG